MGRDMGTDKVVALSFPNLNPEECVVFATYFELQQFAKDSLLMDQGDLGDFMGIVLNGKLAIKKETIFPGKFTLIAVLERGAMVGEVALAEETIRTASVVAQEEGSMLVLSHKRAADLFENHPVMGVKILKRILKVVGGRLQLASARLAQLL